MSRFRGPTPQGVGPVAGLSPLQAALQSARQQHQQSGNEVITLDDGPSSTPVRLPVPPRQSPAAGRGGRGRGGRRGRPRLDPDTDLDFSPEPSSANQEMMLARLQAVAAASRSSSGNES